MVSLLQVCVLIMAGLFAALVVRKDKPEYATLIILLTSFFGCNESSWRNGRDYGGNGKLARDT